MAFRGIVPHRGSITHSAVFFCRCDFVFGVGFGRLVLRCFRVFAFLFSRVALSFAVVVVSCLRFLVWRWVFSVVLRLVVRVCQTATALLS